MRGVSRAQKRRNAYYAAFFGFVGVGSFLGSIVLGFVVARAISQSGFFTYLSLVWSDTELISYYTKEFLFSIGESLPVMEMIAFLGVLFLFFWSLRAFANTRTQWEFLKTQQL